MTGLAGRVARRMRGLASRLARPSAQELAHVATRTAPAADGAEGAARAEEEALARLEVALDVVARVEALEPSLRTAAGPVPFWARGRVARRPEIKKRVLSAIPRPEREGWGADAPGIRRVDAPVAADAVVLGKFDLGELPKLRAVYAKGRRSLAVRPPRPNGICGITRSVTAYQVVAEHAPGLAPGLLGHGELPEGLRYLVETWVRGQVFGTARELAAAGPEILEGLRQLQQGYGVTWVRLGEQWGQTLAGRWEQVRELDVVLPELGGWVGELIARDGALRSSWVHGDMVASNVVRGRDGKIILVDWEYSTEAPIMVDAAKLHLFSATPEVTLTQILDLLGTDHRTAGVDCPGGIYLPAEELALCHAQLIGQYPRRRKALAGHRRAEVYERQIRRQVARLEQVRALTVG
ncbi:phosphotransferase [Ornithinimicrobium panacihumi]|uniref:phosphotransferase n=1 Tax=Ornithinimicrobium panacihumi TaxID=2008449 RepID=UPI003F8C57A4